MNKGPHPKFIDLKGVKANTIRIFFDFQTIN